MDSKVYNLEELRKFLSTFTLENYKNLCRNLPEYNGNVLKFPFYLGFHKNEIWIPFTHQDKFLYLVVDYQGSKSFFDQETKTFCFEPDSYYINLVLVEHINNYKQNYYLKLSIQEKTKISELVLYDHPESPSFISLFFEFAKQLNVKYILASNYYSKIPINPKRKINYSFFCKIRDGKYFLENFGFKNVLDLDDSTFSSLRSRLIKKNDAKFLDKVITRCGDTRVYKFYCSYKSDNITVREKIKDFEQNQNQYEELYSIYQKTCYDNYHEKDKEIELLLLKNNLVYEVK